MKTFSSKYNKYLRGLVVGLLGFVVLLTLFESSNVLAIQTYTKEESPFGTPHDVWLGKWWEWWIKTNSGGNVPTPNGCIINKSDKMVMLMETTVTGKPHQVCEISADQGIMIPLWTAFMEASTPEFQNSTYEQLSNVAREQLDLGSITSLVKIDDVPVAKLDEVSTMRGDTLDYKINSIDNVTEVYSKGFNITIPEDVNYPDQKSWYMAFWSSWMVRLLETTSTR